MKLVFTDAKDGSLVFVARVIKGLERHEVIETPQTKTYSFDVECALYMLDNDITEGQCDDGDDDSQAYMNWALLDDFVECAQIDDGFVCQWFDGEVITHDEFFETYDEVLAACDTYIKAGLFGSYVS